ncbi:MAG: hypothetical protein ACRBF0_03010 [Calditrichia bacterium]
MFALFAGLIFFLRACDCGTGGSAVRGSTLESLKSQMTSYPEYTIILEDMNEEGNFSTDYYHKYRVVYASGENNSDGTPIFSSINIPWKRVSESDYRKYEKSLGMALVTKKDGEESTVEQPPGYDYVGDERYGRWESQPGGGSSFWVWYGTSRILGDLFRMGNRGRIDRGDWTTYRDHRRSGRTYYGKKNEYGTSGSYTKKSNPDFFQRRQMRQSSSKESFRNKVQKRTRRTNMSRTRSRSSGGFGK